MWSSPPLLGMPGGPRSEEHTSELQYRTISYAVFCLKKKKINPFSFEIYRQLLHANCLLSFDRVACCRLVIGQILHTSVTLLLPTNCRVFFFMCCMLSD